LKVYIGIDPGQTGAIAFIIAGTARVYDFDDGDALSFLKKLWLADEPTKAVIEKVGSMPGQGVSSTFKFGTNFGTWIGRLEALEIPFDFVTPQKWKKAMFDSMPKGDTKEMSRNRALRLFPHMAESLKRKKDHNRAEALLLAQYAMMTDGTAG
jgi:crossover junction endodeoxyribonuclease RuvC